jgi:N-acyl-D-aspartate/D-glutamate deacylase
MIDSYAYATTMIARAVREREFLPMEEAIHMITDVPARLYWVRDRGRVVVGTHADICVFDPATIGPGPVCTKFDLPGGAGRLNGEANGIHHVLVNGVEVVRGRQFTNARPGKLLRSGRRHRHRHRPVTRAKFARSARRFWSSPRPVVAS